MQECTAGPGGYPGQRNEASGGSTDGAAGEELVARGFLWGDASFRVPSGKGLAVSKDEVRHGSEGGLHVNLFHCT